MTRNDAIDVLKANYPDAHYSELREAVDLAIKVLEEPERKKGRWLNKGRKICCSECGRVNFSKPNFCDECGADMREEKNDE